LQLEEVPFFKLGDHLVQLMVGFCNIGIVLFPVALTVFHVTLNHPTPTLLGGGYHIFGNLPHELVQSLHDTLLCHLAHLFLSIQPQHRFNCRELFGCQQTVHRSQGLSQTKSLCELSLACCLRPGLESLGDPGSQEVECGFDLLGIVGGVTERVEGKKGVAQGGELEGQRFGRLIQREVEG
jgi:hypothetical protein